MTKSKYKRSQSLRKFYQTEKGKRLIEVRNEKIKRWWASGEGKQQRTVIRQKGKVNVEKYYAAHGGTHPPEVRERISQRTKEALAGTSANRKLDPLERKAIALGEELGLTLPIWLIITTLLDARQEEMEWNETHKEQWLQGKIPRRKISMERGVRLKLRQWQELFDLEREMEEEELLIRKNRV